MSNTMQNMMLVQQDNLSSYFRTINSYPMLTADEEYSLADRLYHHEDIEAAKKLILPHLRFVAKIARGYSGYGLPQADLIQEGNVGLMKAVKRFNPNMGVRLASFAVHWIKSEMHEFVLKNWRIVKVATTKAQRKLFFNLRKNKQRLGWFSDDEVSMVAKELGVEKKDVLEMESRLSGMDMSYDLGQDSDDDYVPEMYIEDESSNFSQDIEESNYDTQVNDKIGSALMKLDERSQQIIQARWLNEEKSTLQELASQFNISAERVRQLESSALNQLKRAVSI